MVLEVFKKQVGQINFDIGSKAKQQILLISIDVIRRAGVFPVVNTSMNNPCPNLVFVFQIPDFGGTLTVCENL